VDNVTSNSHNATLHAEAITGLILAGGRGSRMGGVDKGLQNFNGVPLALHTLMRLSPQVGEVMVNANRNLAAYEAFGVPVWPDSTGLGEFATRRCFPMTWWRAWLRLMCAMAPTSPSPPRPRKTASSGHSRCFA
jgi:hypothetical protein